MNADDVHAILNLLAGAGIEAWVDGGWGVDALIMEATRLHSDLDLVVPLQKLDEIRRMLADAGYDRILRDLRPVALAVADRTGRQVDLHLVTFTADGGGDQTQPDGSSFHYAPPVLGEIDGRQVRCVDADTQVRAHLGYEPTTKDRQDMATLRDRLGVRLPPEYDPHGNHR